MAGEFVLVQNGKVSQVLARVFLDGSTGHNEAWLRDTLFRNPQILPLNDIDPTFGPLIPICTELRTEGGIVDAVFMNPNGRLTLVECKLWRNPQARREVVAQLLDYVGAISAWGYADLQRQVAAAVKTSGNVPFEKVRQAVPDVREAEFIDAATRALREGRILALVVGDGIREEVQRLAETINKGAYKAFSFGLVEAAVFAFGDPQSVLVQPRVLMKTEILTREVALVREMGPEDLADSNEASDEDARSKDHLKSWWKPVLEMTFDDPEQEPAYWVVTNNAVLSTPYPGILIKAYARVGGNRMEVFVSGTRRNNTRLLEAFIRSEREALENELPPGTIIAADDVWPIRTVETEIEGDEARWQWLREVLNQYVNVLRPRLRRWHAEVQRT